MSSSNGVKKVKRHFSLWRNFSPPHPYWLNLALRSPLTCIVTHQDGYWMHTHARGSCDCVCFMIAQTPWRALSNPWSRTLGCVHMLKVYRHYLLGNLLHIYMDHKRWTSRPRYQWCCLCLSNNYDWRSRHFWWVLGLWDIPPLGRLRL
jgi:hypothetical protein